MTPTFLIARIDALEVLIVAYETALTALITGGVVSYTLDTGQSKQTVTKQDVTKLQEALDGLMNQLAVYEARLTGNGTLIGRGSW